MAITLYLAMTAAEIGGFSPLPPKMAWMACHFSPYSTGISNFPANLPPDSMLILSDIIPIHRHDFEQITVQLSECIHANKCTGLLLDFQRKDCAELDALARHLRDSLPCPVAYEGNDNGPVFLPPIPCSISPATYLKPWENREVWLEIGLTAEVLSVTESGCTSECISSMDIADSGMKDEKLHIHYHIDLLDQEARFTLWRTKEDLRELLEEAESLGIRTAVGLWQELG